MESSLNLREAVGIAVHAHIASLGLDFAQMPSTTPPESVQQLVLEQGFNHRTRLVAPENKAEQSIQHRVSIAQSIESYLKDVEPPQRELKTYQEYRAVLYRFRDNCNKVNVSDIDRQDCLEFIRHLYSIGNEARTVYNRIGIVLQWLRLHGITNTCSGGVISPTM